jgi:hypothetical protein
MFVCEIRLMAPVLDVCVREPSLVHLVGARLELQFSPQGAAIAVHLCARGGYCERQVGPNCLALVLIVRPQKGVLHPMQCMTNNGKRKYKILKNT